MEGHRRKNSWLTIGVGCCASRDNVAVEKKGSGGMLNKSPFVTLAGLVPTQFIIALALFSLQLQHGGDTPVCLAVKDPHHVELRYHPYIYALELPDISNYHQVFEIRKNLIGWS
jgi:hypothetical protein